MKMGFSLDLFWHPDSTSEVFLLPEGLRPGNQERASLPRLNLSADKPCSETENGNRFTTSHDLLPTMIRLPIFNCSWNETSPLVIHPQRQAQCCSLKPLQAASLAVARNGALGPPIA
ncbi:hypothetical protein HZ326_16808 [Fusarium oxysporum f. sp. albedinis]|nr:hypothetical protein HZ326_16808 [Fusarium oxysporum f. sp. albedinis]